ncbi:hypothetical protein [Roseomonas sp. BN140053]|uniref:hypothetical protein n=1 Tax=Roseomonas sp. BN140053 TaxID=3391898 RepID=UPI0039E968A3
MIDNFCILLSTGMCVYVIIQAIRLDRMLPWFELLPKSDAAGTLPSASAQSVARQAPAPQHRPAPDRAGPPSRPGWRARAAAAPRNPAP